jgi:hypothetical protein
MPTNAADATAATMTCVRSPSSAWVRSSQKAETHRPIDSSASRAALSSTSATSTSRPASSGRLMEDAASGDRGASAADAHGDSGRDPVRSGVVGRVGDETGVAGCRPAASGAGALWGTASGDWISSFRIAARARSQDRSRPIASRSHAGARSAVGSDSSTPCPASSAGSSAGLLVLDRPEARPWPGPVDPPVAAVPPPDSISTTETVSKVAARSSVVPERLRSCGTCCTDPLVACESTPAADDPAGQLADDLVIAEAADAPGARSIGRDTVDRPDVFNGGVLVRQQGGLFLCGGVRHRRDGGRGLVGRGDDRPHVDRRRAYGLLAGANQVIPSSPASRARSHVVRNRGAVGRVERLIHQRTELFVAQTCCHAGESSSRSGDP